MFKYLFKIVLKVHYCKFENLLIYPSSSEQNYVEDFTFKHLLLFEIYTREIDTREKFFKKFTNFTVK